MAECGLLMNNLTHSYDEEVDMHYIDLGNSSIPKKVAYSLESTAIVDLDNDNNIIGFEIFGIKHRIDQGK